MQGAALYGRTLLILAGFLAAGFVANLLVRPLAERWFMAPSELPAATSGDAPGGAYGIGRAA